MIICEHHGNEILNCSNDDAVIDVQYAQLQLVKAKGDTCSKSTASKKTLARKTTCKSNFNVLSRVKTKCQQKTWCNLSVKSIQDDYCPTESKFLRISYGCVKRSNNILGSFLHFTRV